MSTEEGFLDVLYLGIFVILSSAFDSRFYASSKPPPVILDEIKCATSHFRALFHFFSSRFIILLEDELFAPSYVFDRMLGEFAAAAVVFSKGVQKARGDSDIDGGVSIEKFPDHIERILQDSHPNVFSYYSRCLDRGHKHFLWTGPKMEILARTDEVEIVVPLLNMGESKDHPAQPIYSIGLEAAALPPPAVALLTWKHHDREDGLNPPEEHPIKRVRQP